MRLRLVLGAAILGTSLVLLAMSANLGVEASRASKIGSLIGVAFLYFGSMWLRDRFFPPKSSERDSGQVGVDKDPSVKAKSIRRYWNAWALIAGVFVLIGAPLLLMMRVDTALTGLEVTRLMFKVSAWGVLVVTAAVSIASLPRSSADQLTQWWLPGSVLLFLGYVVTSRLPEMVSLIAGKPDAAQPNVATLLLIPIIVFAWRSIQFLKSRRPPRTE